MFKINRDNAILGRGIQPKIELVDCQSDLLEQIIDYDPRRSEHYPTTGVIVEPYVLEDFPESLDANDETPNRGEYANKIFNLNTLCGGEIVDTIL